MSHYYPDPLPVPDGLDSQRLRLRMLRPQHVQLDYEAVMASQQQLLRFTNGRWPRPGFTLEENLADLEMHEREHLEREAFTFTVLSPGEDRCLGCLYLTPLSWTLDRLEIPPGVRPPVTERHGQAHFWLRPEAWELEAELLDELRRWFEDAWQFETLFFVTNVDQPRQLELFERAGLELSFRLTGADGRAWFLFRD